MWYAPCPSQCMYWNDRQISEAFDRLATADGSARDTLVRNLESVLSTPDFMQRAGTFLLMDNGYYRPPSDRSRDELKAFEAKQAKMHLFPTCKEVRVDAFQMGKQTGSRRPSVPCHVRRTRWTPCRAGRRSWRACAA